MHLCLECGHRGISHRGGDRGYSSCVCCRGEGQIDAEPTVVETFDLAGRAQPLMSPGSVWNAESPMHRVVLCSCDACRRVHSAIRATDSAQAG